MKDPFTLPGIGINISVALLFLTLGQAWAGAVIEEGNTMNDIVVNILVSVGTTLVMAAASYFVLLKRMPDKIGDVVIKQLNSKMDPSNKALQDEHLSTSQLLHMDHERLYTEHEKLRGYLEETAKRQAADDARYGQLDSSGRGIVDAVKKLDAFSAAFQMMNDRIIELEQQVMELQVENERLRIHEQKREHEHEQEEYQGELI